jgi:hypothetical protein
MPATKPYAIPRRLDLSEAKEIADRIVPDDRGVARDDICAVAQFVQMLDPDPTSEIAELRRTCAAEGQRLHAANVEIHDLRNKLQGVSLRATIAEKAAREREKDLSAQLAEAIERRDNAEAMLLGGTVVEPMDCGDMS